MSVQQRTAMDAESLTRAVAGHSGLFSEVRVVAETGSTNTDLLAGGGTADGAVLVAESQTAGRGRQGRTWTTQPGDSLTFSVLLRPSGVPTGRWSWLPLLAGTALAAAVIRICAVGVRLKWPNDLLFVGTDAEALGAGDVATSGAPDGKLAGILAERAGETIVIGTGVNVSGAATALPAGATSLAAAGVRWISRQQVLVTTLMEFEKLYLAWLRSGGDPEASGVRAHYRHLSATVGQQVKVELPGGEEVHGTARDIDELGRLVLVTGSGERPVSAGDVIHVR